MQYNIVLSGVGGQGILAVATIIAKAAMDDGLLVRQSEIHGMSQRGGDVSALVRISDQPIPSDMIPHGTADMILSMEPLEGLRYLKLLAPWGIFLTAKEPVLNIKDYPAIAEVYRHIQALERHVILDAKKLAEEAGSIKAVNMVLVGAAAPHLPVQSASLERAIRDIFARKGEAMVAMNLKALQLGKERGGKL